MSVRSLIHRAVAVVVCALSAGVLVTASAASAAPSITKLDVSGHRFFNACTDEYVVIEDGTLQIVTDTRRDSAGGVHVTVRGNAQKVVARGETSGVTYHLAGDWWGEVNARPDGSPIVVHLVEVHNMVSEGPSENVTVHAVAHVTINANGTTSTTIDSFTSECRG